MPFFLVIVIVIVNYPTLPSTTTLLQVITDYNQHVCCTDPSSADLYFKSAILQRSVGRVLISLAKAVRT